MSSSDLQRKWRLYKADQRLREFKPAPLIAPRVTGLHCDDAFGTLDVLQRQLANEGPLPELAQGARQLKATVLKECRHTAERERLVIGCDEVLRDVGVLPEKWQQLAQSCRAIMQYWNAKGRRSEVARGRLTLALIHRSLSKYPDAIQQIGLAVDMLRDLPETDDVLRLQHLGLQLKVRLHGIESRTPQKQQPDTEHLRRLAARLDTPDAWLDTWRELAGYYRAIGRWSEAERYLDEAAAVRPSVTNPFKQRAALRGDIEYCRKIRDTVRVKTVLLPEYEHLCELYPSKYHTELAVMWRAELSGYRVGSVSRPVLVVPWVG